MMKRCKGREEAQLKGHRDSSGEILVHRDSGGGILTLGGECVTITLHA